jgi:hypothetical protein
MSTDEGIMLRKDCLTTGTEAFAFAVLIWSIFGIHVDFLRAAKGGFFLMKKPLEFLLSVYSNSENAIACLRSTGACH